MQYATIITSIIITIAETPTITPMYTPGISLELSSPLDINKMNYNTKML